MSESAFKKACFLCVASVAVMGGLRAETAPKKPKLDAFLPSGRTALLEAIYADSTAEVERLLASGASPFVQSEYGDSPAFVLFREAEYSAARLEILKLLVAAGVPVDYTDPNSGASDTLLLRAAAAGHLAEFEWLLAAGADTGYRDAWGRGILLAIYERPSPARQLPLLESLIRHGADLPTLFRSDDGARVLRMICEYRLVADLRFVLDAGVPVAEISLDGQNALFWFSRGYPEGKTGWPEIAAAQISMAKLLLEAGCDPSARDASDKTALWTACERRNFRLASFLRSAEKKSSNDPALSTEGYLESCFGAGLAWNLDDHDLAPFESLLVQFLDDGMDSSAALYPTCRVTESLTLAELLLDRGADPDAGTSLSPSSSDSYRNESTLHLAVSDNRIDLIRALLSRGADPDLQDGEGKTPLMIATQRESFDLLMKAGARLDIADEKGWTALHYAAVQGYDFKLSGLLAKGADLEAADSVGFNPFDLAIGYRNAESALFLAKAGSDVRGSHDNGQNALLYFMRDGVGEGSADRELCRFLLEAGLRADTKDNTGKNVLYWIAVNPDGFQETLVAEIHASVDPTAIAEAEALVRADQKAEAKALWKENTRSSVIALAFPVLLTTLSLMARESWYAGDPSANWMGTVNASLGMIALCGVGGGVLGYILDKSTGYNSGGFLNLPVFTILGVFGGMTIGLFMPMIPAVRDTFKNNAALYYMPVAIVDFAALWRVIALIK